jgi:hypothetical protein
VQVAITGNPFTGVSASLTGANAPEISNFGRITPFAVNAALQRLAQWLEDIGGSASVFGQDVPFADSAKMKDLLSFSTALTEVVNNHLKNAEGVPDFGNAQQFADRLATLLGLSTGAIAAGYNTSTNQLTFFFRLDHSFANQNLPVGFDLNLDPLGGISTSSNLSVAADGRCSSRWDSTCRHSRPSCWAAWCCRPTGCCLPTRCSRSRSMARHRWR